MQVVLNRRDKEQLVIDLHGQGKTIREIASASASVIQRYWNSTDTKALWLFSIGKKPIEVAIELNLSASEVHEMQEEFWALTQLYELASVYNEIKSFLPLFLKLFHCLKERRMLDEKHISKLIGYANYDLSDLSKSSMS